MTDLPGPFLDRMKHMLKGEYQDFLASYGKPRLHGLRVNTMKITPQRFEEISPFSVKPIPWVKDGFYYEGDVHPASDPYYTAGLYYLQEPSAMTPASRLPIEKGDKVLDLCAAPGGKSTHLAARLYDTGILVANDISASRAKALLYNLEVFGAGNIFVTNEIPGKLSEVFEGWFDKVLVDAPCSGEGMFRKACDVAKTWDEQRPRYFAKIQKDIVSNAVKMLKPGGMMLYSTCTFSPEENEGTISWLLWKYPEMELADIASYEGFRPGVPDWGDGNEELKKCVHIWPHHMEGEGHFLALLRKKGQQLQEKTFEKRSRKKALSPSRGLSKEERRLLGEFLRETRISDAKICLESDHVESRGGRAYLIPKLPDASGSLHFLRYGLLLGEFKKNRFEPSQAFAMSLTPELCGESICLQRNDERVLRYLKGETIQVPEEACSLKKGWKLMCVDQYPLGWGKLQNDVVKNKYLSAWRKK